MGTEVTFPCWYDDEGILRQVGPFTPEERVIRLTEKEIDATRPQQRKLYLDKCVNGLLEYGYKVVSDDDKYIELRNENLGVRYNKDDCSKLVINLKAIAKVKIV